MSLEFLLTLVTASTRSGIIPACPISYWSECTHLMEKMAFEGFSLDKGMQVDR